VLGGLVVALSVYVVSFRRGLAGVAILLAIPAMVQHVLNPSLATGFFPIGNMVLSFAFDVWIVVSIFRRVFSNVRITSETIFGALCIYLLNGMSFASIYGLVRDLQPSAFFLDPAVNRHAIPDRFDFIYYSFGTMTQLGAAGITAVTDQARSLSVIEAILGQLYLAVLISRLVAAYRMTSPAANS
jgi:Ion channel